MVNNISTISDYQAEDYTIFVSQLTIRRLSKLSAWKSITIIALQWLLIIGAISIAEYFHQFLITLLAIIWIGARQHAIAILMHEGTHFRILKNKALNDIITEFFLAWPLFISMRSYRINHLAHHRHLNTELDPDWYRKRYNQKEAKNWNFPMKPKYFLWVLMKDLFAINTIAVIKNLFSLSKNKSSQARLSNKKYTVTRIIFYTVAAFVITYFHLWQTFLLYWIVPIFTWFALSLRIRGIAEHFAIYNSHTLNMSRTTYPNIFEKLFIAPLNVCYHLDHHLYPSVPFYNLPKLHKILLGNNIYKNKAHLTKTYFGVLMECLKPINSK